MGRKEDCVEGGGWVNDGWSEEQVRKELQGMVKLIDEELRKVQEV